MKKTMININGFLGQIMN